ncbi:MAG: hypothetical protein WD048_08070 [Chitinophagales bacterium]
MNRITRIAGSLLLFCFFVLMLNACSKEDDGIRKDTSIDGQFRGTIKLTANHIYRLSIPQEDSLAENAKITLYRTYEDLSYEKSPVISGTTDSLGRANFYQLPDSVYYINAVYNNESVEEQVNLSGEINFVEINFY